MHHAFAFAFQCFAVRSLGWVEMAEEDLAPGKSSVAVNNCIRQLSYCKNDIRDTVGIWGEVSHPWRNNSYFPVFSHASLAL